jgi:chromosome segregation ATPase
LTPKPAPSVPQVSARKLDEAQDKVILFLFFLKHVQLLDAENQIKSKTIQILRLEEQLRESGGLISELKKEQQNLTNKNDELHQNSKQQHEKVLNLMKENSEQLAKFQEVTEALKVLKEELVVRDAVRSSSLDLPSLTVRPSGLLRPRPRLYPLPLLLFSSPLLFSSSLLLLLVSSFPPLFLLLTWTQREETVKLELQVALEKKEQAEQKLREERAAVQERVGGEEARQREEELQGLQRQVSLLQQQLQQAQGASQQIEGALRGATTEGASLRAQVQDLGERILEEQEKVVHLTMRKEGEEKRLQNEMTTILKSLEEKNNAVNELKEERDRHRDRGLELERDLVCARRGEGGGRREREDGEGRDGGREKGRRGEGRLSG